MWYTEASDMYILAPKRRPEGTTTRECGTAQKFSVSLVVDRELAGLLNQQAMDAKLDMDGIIRTRVPRRAPREADRTSFA